tara:strand:- start:1031 stop:1435 length:405 start_codon:yes stop_codon:yes gene_type:complete
MAGIGDDILRIGTAFSAREHNGANRLFLGAAAGPCNPGDCDRDIGITLFQNALRHAPCNGDRNRSKGFEKIEADIENLKLRIVRIGDESRFEHVRRTRNFGERGGDEPAGAAFCKRNPPVGGAVRLNHTRGGFA